MKKRGILSRTVSIMLILSVVSAFTALGQESTKPGVIQLNKPDFTRGMPLMKALKERKTNRNIADLPLPEEKLSGLLWAVNGQNRDDGRRTAPSAMNRQMVDLYVVLTEGIYLYKPAEHLLELKVAGDYRKLAGGQPFVSIAPVNLIFVADFGKWKSGEHQPSREELVTFAGIEAGCQAQNAYLYGASEGLAVVVRGSVNKEEVTQLLGLTADQYIVAAQTIGMPK